MTERYAEGGKTRALLERALEGVERMHAVHHGEDEDEFAELSATVSAAYSDVGDDSLTLKQVPWRGPSGRRIPGERSHDAGRAKRMPST